eukprot:1013877_1
MFCCRAKSDEDVPFSNDMDNVIIDVTNAPLSSIVSGSGKDGPNGVATTGKVGIRPIVMVLCLVITSLLCFGAFHCLKGSMKLQLKASKIDGVSHRVSLVVKNLPPNDENRDYHWKVVDRSGNFITGNVNNTPTSVKLSEALVLQNGYVLKVCYPADDEEVDWEECFRTELLKLEIPDDLKAQSDDASTGSDSEEFSEGHDDSYHTQSDDSSTGSDSEEFSEGHDDSYHTQSDDSSTGSDSE